MNITKRRVFATTAIAALILSACSSDEDEPSASASAPQEEESAGGEDEEPEPEPEAEPDSEGNGFYTDQSIELIVPVGAGGSTDATARLLAQHLSEELEGNPSIQVVNMPGGGSIIGTNFFELNAEHDGTTLLFSGSTPRLPWILGLEEVEFDYSQYAPLWAAGRSSVVYFSEASGVQTAQDLLTPAEPLAVGAVSPTGLDLPMFISFETLGIADDVNKIIGYEDNDLISAAFSAGELNMRRLATPTVVRNLEDDMASGAITVLYAHGFPDGEGGVMRDPLLPDVPTIAEVYEEIYGEPPTGTEWEAYVMLTGLLSSGDLALWTHGDAPPEAIGELEAAMARVEENPEFLAAADELVGQAPHLLGDELEAWRQNSVGGLDPELIEWIKDYASEEFGLTFD